MRVILLILILQTFVQSAFAACGGFYPAVSEEAKWSISDTLKQVDERAWSGSPVVNAIADLIYDLYALRSHEAESLSKETQPDKFLMKSYQEAIQRNWTRIEKALKDKPNAEQEFELIKRMKFEERSLEQLKLLIINRYSSTC